MTTLMIREVFRAVMEIIAPACYCVWAVNGQAALEMLNAGEIPPDIIFLDLNMPLMNGHQFLQEINRLKILQDIPIVVLTTSADVNTKATMRALRAKEFITKPINFLIGKDIEAGNTNVF
jgi:CheY-like chemotaxis protein